LNGVLSEAPNIPPPLGRPKVLLCEAETPRASAAFNYPATRKTLIQRLKDRGDQASRDEFSRIYPGFVFKAACKAGLSETEANEVVQETFIRVAKNMRKNQVHP